MAINNNSRKHVVSFDAQGLLGNKTGVGYFSSQLIEHLAYAMPEIEFVGYYYDFLRHSPVALPTGANISYVRHWLMPIQLVNLLRRFRVEIPLELRIFRRADIVLFMNYLSAPSLFKTPGIGFVYDLSFLDHAEFVSKKNQADLSRFVPVTIERSGGIVTISEFTKNRLLEYFPALHGHLTVIPIPPPAASKSTKPLNKQLREHGISEQKYILSVGTLEPRKNIGSLVSAYSLLPKQLRDTYALVLVGGKGWQDEEFVSLISQQREAGLNIIQTGYVSDSDRIALYQHAACFVFPSHYEGFGMPIFEALQYNVPIAVSDIPVFHEVAGDSALYFDKDDPSDMAATIHTILENEQLRRRLCEYGKKRLSDFSWESNTRQLRTILTDLL